MYGDVPLWIASFHKYLGELVDGEEFGVVVGEAVPSIMKREIMSEIL